MDERLLDAIRELWDEARVRSTYAAVLEAYASAATKEVVISSTSFDGSQASGNLVLDREGMVQWMEVLNFRLKEIAAEAEGLTGPFPGSPPFDFSRRIIGT